MEYQFRLGDSDYKINLQPEQSGKYRAEIEGETFEFEYIPISENCLSLIMGENTFTIYHCAENSKKYVYINGAYFELEEISARDRFTRSVGTHDRTETGDTVSAPMPGRILKILVQENQSVEIDQPLFIIESMKMENEVHSRINGLVKKINYRENDLVAVGDPVILLEKKET
ncbi:MAG: hypothetical protein Kow0042_07410 [Calditrichia bacterium]